jgi:hypothetical protein
MITKILEYFRETNFFDKPTFIRKIQCSVFGHPKHSLLLNYYKKPWCTWCASYIKIKDVRKEPNNGK